MEKIKQVFSHDKHADTSANTNTANTARGAPFDNASSGTTAQTPTSSAAGDRSASERIADKVEGRATHDSTAPHRTDPLELTHSTNTGATTGTTGVGHNTGSHLREHAHPPSHHHNQPRTDGLLDEAGAKSATHDHQHLAPVTHETRQRHEVEEIERQREVDRHVHHVQHHVQPVLDTHHHDERQHENVVQPTHIKENHVATDEDKAQFASLATGHDHVKDLGKERTIIDRGEKVHENTTHHVHHVVQPQIERDVHEHHRIHTTVPIHHTTHEAPIVHESVQHAPLKIDEFTKNGGDLNSSLKHTGDLLNRGECERTVDGPAENLTHTLGLGNSSSGVASGEQRAL